jgi:hypothetical protein
MIKYSSIKRAFIDDNEISKYCDFEDKDKDVRGLVGSIYRKIGEYQDGNDRFYDLVLNEEVIGYIFCYKNLLVSFGVNSKYRNKETLIFVFDQIKSKFNGNFEAYMWTRNERAIKWLLKCGMQEESCNIKNVTKLKY